MQAWRNGLNRLRVAWHRRENQRLFVAIVVGLSLILGIGVGVYRNWPSDEVVSTNQQVSVEELEELVETRDGEIKLLESENLMLRQQVTEYKFLYENTKPTAFDKAATVGLGAGVAAVLYFLVQFAN